MKKILSVSLSLLFILALVLSTTAFAARSTIYLSTNQVWTSKNATRTGSYSYVHARCYAVYPPSGTDLYTKIQCRVTTSGGTAMSNTVTLSETAGSSTSIYLYEGYLSNTNIKFQFRGNNPNDDAYTDVYYDGM